MCAWDYGCVFACDVWEVATVQVGGGEGSLHFHGRSFLRHGLSPYTSSARKWMHGFTSGMMHGFLGVLMFLPREVARCLT